MVFLITYDLNKNNKNYPGVYRAIEELGETHRDPDLDSVWFVSTSHTMDQVYNHVKKEIDENDRLFVTRLISGSYLGWLSKTAVDWLGSKTH